MELIRDMLRDGPIGWAVLGFFVIVIGAVLFLIVELGFGDTRPITVTVLEASYTPSRTGVGVGPVTTGSGVGTAVVVTSSGPRYDMKVQFQDGTRDFIRINKETLLAVNVGDRIMLACFYGGLTGNLIRCEAP